MHLRSIVLQIATSGVLLIGFTGLSVAQDQEEEDQEQSWNLSLGPKYLSRFTGFGIDLSQDEPAVALEAGLQHVNGLSFGAEAIGRTGENAGYQQSTFHVGYGRPVTKALKLSGVYTYYAYKSDTVNALADISNSLTLGATLDVKRFLVSASYNLFFGAASANYFLVGLSTSARVWNMTIQPALQVSFGSQTVDVSLLPKNRGKGEGAQKKIGGATTETITGLSSLSFVVAFSQPVGQGFTLTLSPAYEYSPTDLGARSSQFLWTAGLEYSTDF